MQLQKFTAMIVCAMVLLMLNTASAAVMNNDDVIKLVKSRVSDSLIMKMIDDSTAAFDTSVDGLIKLKKNGVSDTLIQKMMTRKPGSGPNPAAASNATAAPAATPVISSAVSQTPGTATGTAPTSPPPAVADNACKFEAPHNHLIIKDQGKSQFSSFRQATLEENVSSGSVVASMFTFGLAPMKSTAYAVLSGGHASLRVRVGMPEILELTAERGVSHQDAFNLVRLQSDKGRRLVSIGETSESLFTGKQKIAFPAAVLIPLRVDTLVQECMYEGKRWTVYRAQPLQPLSPGEYAIAYGMESYYDFGVD